MCLSSFQNSNAVSQAYRIDQRINSKLDQVQSLRGLAEKATAIISDTVPSGTRNFHRMEDVICRPSWNSVTFASDLGKKFRWLCTSTSAGCIGSTTKLWTKLMRFATPQRFFQRTLCVSCARRTVDLRPRPWSTTNGSWRTVVQTTGRIW